MALGFSNGTRGFIDFRTPKRNQNKDARSGVFGGQILDG
jgi:hypothetical protein